MDIEPFLKVYRNKYLRIRIFNLIKEINQQLHYFVYDFYNLPIEIIINNNDRQLLISRLIIYKINNHKILDYPTDNKDSLVYSLFKWKEFDFELYNLINDIYPNLLTLELSHLIILLENGKLELFKEFESMVDFEIHVSKLNFNFKNSGLNKDSINQVLNYIKFNYGVDGLGEEGLFSNLINIIEFKRSNEFGELFLDQVKSEGHYFKLLQLSLEKSDYEMYKIILKKFKDNYKYESFEFMNKVYQFITNLIINKNIIIDNEKLSKLLKYNYQKKLKLSQRCLNDNLDNLEFFKNKKNIEWIINDDISSTDKFNYFKEIDVYLGHTYLNKYFSGIDGGVSTFYSGGSGGINDHDNLISMKYQLKNETQLIYENVLNIFLSNNKDYWSLEELIDIYLKTGIEIIKDIILEKQQLLQDHEENTFDINFNFMDTQKYIPNGFNERLVFFKRFNNIYEIKLKYINFIKLKYNNNSNKRFYFLGFKM